MDMLIGKVVKEVIRPDELVNDYLKITFVDGSELEVMPSNDGSRGLDVCTIKSALYLPVIVLWRRLKAILAR